ncbi:hypothetical protein CVT25_000618 [Psilocybe cyanescens]|uniref:PIN domain-like protein n=1 Tax=Psilocybe cyanescens TaxID=93625 RepID=A0A409XWC2_PSICY|nr:hypothetical protein CVT25_000618 [Psilocybe cyanescens]
MGVKGLNLFVKNICPTVFKELPNRLEALRGKKVVIDGTLITQRYHYARQNYEHRHIYGWFRLARDLERAGVSAVCVFDGKERSDAKAEEVQRRRDLRQLVGERWSVENARYERLHKLKEGIQLFQTLDISARQQVLQSLKEPSFTKTQDSTALQRELLRKQPAASEKPPEFPAQDAATPTTSASPTVPLADVVSIFKSLHVSYKAGVAKLVTISADSEEAKAKMPAAETPEAAEAQDAAEANVMTKKQTELSTEEGQLWHKITQSLDSPTAEIDANVEQSIQELVKQSHEMSESFNRRRNAPDSKIYGESQELLRALGIPCILTTGGIEAEALASSMVLAGHADYVASEDTDVMVYEATLLKNITSYDSPLVTVSGADMRTSLGLTRSQFLDFALLLGTDFTHRIGQIGPTRAYAFIKDHGSIEGVVKHIADNPKYKPTLPWDSYFAQVNIARLVFQTLPPVPPPESFQPTEKNEALAAEILKKYGLAFFLMREDDWDYNLAYAATVGGNYFGDNPSTW